MQKVVRQLERIRQAAKLLLFVRSIARCCVALLAVAIACALLDYALRLPGWLRLSIDVVVLALAVRWLAAQLRVVWRLRPGLGELALRAERLFPQLAGVLASGVEFALSPGDDRTTGRTATFAAASIEQAQQRVRSVRLGRLIRLKQPIYALGLACAMIAMIACAAWAVPAEAALSARRWLAPLGDAQWPRRTHIQSLPHPTVWPADIPLRLSARIDRGYRTGMRVWIEWRLVAPNNEPGQWQRMLMNEQPQPESTSGGEGRFQQLIDLHEAPAWLYASASQPGVVQFQFAAGDDQTEPQSIELVQRPMLQSLSLRIDPPPYARGLMGSQTVELSKQSGQTVTATVLAGSTVQWRMQLNKPIPTANAIVARLLPSLADQVTNATVDLSWQGASTSARPIEDAAQIVVAFRVDRSVQSAVRLTDEHGLTSLSERQWRLEMIQDRPPSATMALPATDQSVLTTAKIRLEAVAQDDVAVRWLALEAAVPDSKVTRQQQSSELLRVDGNHARINAEHNLDLTRWTLQPGDSVVVSAITQDVFELDGRRHDPVRSAARTLSVILPAELVNRIRTDLAGLRRQAIQLEARQQQLTQATTQRSAKPQDQLTRRIQAGAALVEALRQRIELNRLDEPSLGQLVAEATALLHAAQQASDNAHGLLEQVLSDPAHADERIAHARRQQQKVIASLIDLIERLDQGRDALTLQLQLQRMQQMQEDLGSEVRKLLPATLGRTLDELPEQMRRQLEGSAQRQSALAQRARALGRQMRAASEALGQPNADEQDQAAAEALAQAASIAQRSGLDNAMDQAAGAVKRNRLAAAGQDQQQSLRIMRRMLAEFGRQEKRRSQILRRRLLELAEAIGKLIDRQKGQLELLEKAQSLQRLDEPLSLLRSNTMAVQDQAQNSRRTGKVAGELGQAAESQTQAIDAVRNERRRKAADSESESLRRLEAALSLVRNLRDAAEQDSARRTRSELRKDYQELGRRQDELQNRTEPLAKLESLDRRRRADAVAVGADQETLRNDVNVIADRDELPMLFSHVHDRIDTAAGEAARTLRAGKAETNVLDQQASVADMLRQLAFALEEAQRQDKFDTPPADDAGSGGGGAGEAPLIPPATQLRLLRGLQDGVYQRTKQIHNVRDPDTHQRRRQLQQLAVDQRELAALGEKLAQEMRRHLTTSLKPKRSPLP